VDFTDGVNRDLSDRPVLVYLLNFATYKKK